METERTEKAADHLRESSLIADRLCTSGHLEKKEGKALLRSYMDLVYSSC